MPICILHSEDIKLFGNDPGNGIYIVYKNEVPSRKTIKAKVSSGIEVHLERVVPKMMKDAEIRVLHNDMLFSFDLAEDPAEKEYYLIQVFKSNVVLFTTQKNEKSNSYYIKVKISDEDKVIMLKNVNTMIGELMEAGNKDPE